MTRYYGLLIAGMLGLVACGGGGGGGGAGAPVPRTPAPPPTTTQPAPPPTQPPPQTLQLFSGHGEAVPITAGAQNIFTEPSDTDRQYYQNHPQFRMNYALGIINADWLYARAKKNPSLFGSGSGQGIVVGSGEFGIDHTHPMFRGANKIHPESLLSIPVKNYGLAHTDIDPQTLTPAFVLGPNDKEADVITRYPYVGCDPRLYDATTNPSCPYIIQLADGSKRALQLTLSLCRESYEHKDPQSGVISLRNPLRTDFNPAGNTGCTLMTIAKKEGGDQEFIRRMTTLFHETAVAQVMVANRLRLSDLLPACIALGSDGACQTSSDKALYPHGVAFEATYYHFNSLDNTYARILEHLTKHARVGNISRWNWNSYCPRCDRSKPYDDSVIDSLDYLASIRNQASIDAAKARGDTPPAPRTHADVTRALIQAHRDPNERSFIIFSAGNVGETERNNHPSWVRHADLWPGLLGILCKHFDPVCKSLPSERSAVQNRQIAEAYVSFCARFGISDCKGISTRAEREAKKIMPFLTAVMVGPDGLISSQSYRCGEAKYICLAAPGASVSVGLGLRVRTEDEKARITRPNNRASWRLPLGSAACSNAPVASINLLSGQTFRFFVTAPKPTTNLPHVPITQHCVTGTSLAAPYVAGSIAALLSYFEDSLSSLEVVERMLKTAQKGRVTTSTLCTITPTDERCDYGNSDIYGQGLLDLKAASAPVGGLGAPVGQSLSGARIGLQQTGLYVAGAFGDALARAFQGQRLLLLDDLNAPFPTHLNNLITALVPTSRFAQSYNALLFPRLYWAESQGSPQRFGLSLSPSAHGTIEQDAFFLRRSLANNAQALSTSYGVHPALAMLPKAAHHIESNPHMFLPAFVSHVHGTALGLQGQRFGAVVFQGEGEQQAPRSLLWQTTPRTSAIGLLTQAVLHKPTHTRLQLGFLRETGAWLGNAGFGALRLGKSSQTWFLGAHTQLPLAQSWFALASAWAGLSDLDMEGQSLFHSPEPLLSSQFAFALQRASLWRASDRLSLYMAQPLRAEQGRVWLNLPVARTPSGDIRHRNMAVPLTPSGRELAWGMHYTMPVGHGTLALDASFVYAAGHQRDNTLDSQLLLRYRLAF